MDGIYICIPDSTYYKSTASGANKIVLPDEEYVDIDGWINEDGKGEQEEESPLESRRCLSLIQMGVLQAHLQTGYTFIYR